MSPEGFSPFAEPDWPLEPCAGDTHTDPEGRLWTFKHIVGGQKGGRWAYHLTSVDPQRNAVLADTRQNLQAHHFAGMLALPWDGLSKLGWVLGKAWCQPVRDKIVPEPQEGIRFERLSEPPTQEE